MTPDDVGAPQLLDRIRSEIRQGGPIRFARFMELALNDPDHGYYATGADRLGREGDFITAADVGTAFGRCLAKQLEEIDRVLKHPEPFEVREYGGGRGLLARDVLDAVPELSTALADRLVYTIVDTSEAMRARAVREAPRARAVAPGEAADVHTGCAVAVELFDALPVHRVRRRGDALVEVLVGVDADGELVEVEGEPLDDVIRLAERYGAVPSEGDEGEVCPAALSQLDEIAGSLSGGFVIVVDYGFPAPELYGAAHNRGTLLAYHRHSTNEDYLQRVGRQDLTAHVNLTALEDRARETGLHVVGCTTQDRFLIANGALEPFDETDEERWREPARVRERLRLLQLIHPQGMGRTFKVLVLWKGAAPAPALTGLEDPFARD